MPFIRITTNKKLSAEQKVELKTELGKLISLIGKSETWLMIAMDELDSDSMYFQGKDESCAMVEISSYGTIRPGYFDPMTKKVTDVISSIASIDPNRIYVNYREVDHWGLGGENF